MSRHYHMDSFQCFPYHFHITIEYRGLSESTSHPCIFPLLQLRLVFILG